MTLRSVALVVVVTVGLPGAGVSTAACGSGGEEPAGSGGGPGPDSELVVSAAASLTEPFSVIAEKVEAAQPGLDVLVNLGSSAELAAQVRAGAPADVVAFADSQTMDSLAAAGFLAGDPTVFARNRLVVVTPPGNPGDINSLADLESAGTVSLCAEAAPCGRYAAEVLDSAGVRLDEGRVSRGRDVKATLGAVTRGDADAAIVYRSDALAAGESVRTVDLPAGVGVTARYSIGLLRRAADSPAATAFIAQVLGPDGRAALDDTGFLDP